MTGEPLSVSVSLIRMWWATNSTSPRATRALNRSDNRRWSPPWIAPTLTILPSNCKTQDNKNMIELSHLGQRLDTLKSGDAVRNSVQVEEEPGLVEPDDDPDVVEIEAHEDDAHAVEASTGEADDAFTAFITVLESARLRSEAQSLIAEAPNFHIHGIVQSVSRTLLGNERINGHTAHCESAEEQPESCSSLENTLPAAGEEHTAVVAFHDWDEVPGLRRFA